VLTDDDVKVLLEVLFDVRSELIRIRLLLETRMASKETKRKIREDVRADQARYDEVTRRLRERIEYYRRKTESGPAPRRASS